MKEDSIYRKYFTAQTVRDGLAAEEAWNGICEAGQDILARMDAGLDNYIGLHVEAPIGSTYKAHMSLIKRVDEIVDGQLERFLKAAAQIADIQLECSRESEKPSEERYFGMRDYINDRYSDIVRARNSI